MKYPFFLIKYIGIEIGLYTECGLNPLANQKGAFMDMLKVIEPNRQILSKLEK